MMDLIFNELSLYHKLSNIHAAKTIMIQLIKTCKAARKFGFDRMRVRHDFEQLILLENYTILEWLNDGGVSRTYKDLLLSIKRYPYIESSNESIENQFISNYYYFHENDNSGLKGQEVEGFAVAFLYNTLSISLASHMIWKKTEIRLLEKIESREQVVNLKHISDVQHLVVHQNWIDNKLPITPKTTKKSPKNKNINLRKDHGEDILKKFAMKLNNSPYIIETLNSLPYNPNNRRFIKQCYPDGKIEIVLPWTDKGFGIIVLTTGGNLQETKYIADILNKDYGNK